jgi:hypothetical protein
MLTNISYSQTRLALWRNRNQGRVINGSGFFPTFQLVIVNFQINLLLKDSRCYSLTETQFEIIFELKGGSGEMREEGFFSVYSEGCQILKSSAIPPTMMYGTHSDLLP